jgi:cytochrome c oxidase subunit 2
MTRIFVVLIVALAVIALAQLMRIYQLSSKVRNKKEEDISDADNKLNASLMLVSLFAYFGFVIWQIVHWGPYMLPEAASEHGADIDQLFAFNWVLLFAVFFGIHTVLFVFAYKYYYRAGTKAYWYPHNNKLEFIWTIVPSITLAGVIIFGLITWNKIQKATGEGAITIELYSKQFDWTARYTGTDNQLGKSNYLLVSGTNPLGIVSNQTIAERLTEIEETLSSKEQKLQGILPDDQVAEIEHSIESTKRLRARIFAIKQKNENLLTGLDDKIVKGEFHIPVGTEVEFLFRSQDVIHSAYMPHFRLQMNSVPGDITRFVMKPTITTAEMRNNLNNQEFNYILMCNKICGAAHYNMQMNVIVDSPEDYQLWLNEQKPFIAETINKEEVKTNQLADN